MLVAHIKLQTKFKPKLVLSRGVSSGKVGYDQIRRLPIFSPSVPSREGIRPQNGFRLSSDLSSGFNGPTWLSAAWHMPELLERHTFKKQMSGDRKLFRTRRGGDKERKVEPTQGQMAFALCVRADADSTNPLSVLDRGCWWQPQSIGLGREEQGGGWGEGVSLATLRLGLTESFNGTCSYL